MNNLRILTTSVIDSATIAVTFTDNLNENISIGNVSIISQLASAPNPNILTVSINDAILTITCNPLTPLVSYLITFFSTTTVSFESINATALLLQDGVANTTTILGPIDPANPFVYLFNNFLNGGVY